MSPARDRRKRGGHLPPGHAPGAQTRSEKIVRPFNVILAALLDLLCFGGATALLVVASSTPDPSGTRLGAAIFGAGALGLVPVVFLLWRKTYPRRADYLELQVEPIEARRGDTVTATLTVTNERKLGIELELALVCTECYDEKYSVNSINSTVGTTARRTQSFAIVDDARTLDRGQLQHIEHFEIPRNALCSYEGGTVSWAWHVEARDHHRYYDRYAWVPLEARPPGYRPPSRFANFRPHRSDAFCRVPIWVSP